MPSVVYIVCFTDDYREGFARLKASHGDYRVEDVVVPLNSPAEFVPPWAPHVLSVSIQLQLCDQHGDNLPCAAESLSLLSARVLPIRWGPAKAVSSPVSDEHVRADRALPVVTVVCQAETQDEAVACAFRGFGQEYPNLDLLLLTPGPFEFPIPSPALLYAFPDTQAHADSRVNVLAALCALSAADLVIFMNPWEFRDSSVVSGLVNSLLDSPLDYVAAFDNTGSTQIVAARRELLLGHFRGGEDVWPFPDFEITKNDFASFHTQMIAKWEERGYRGGVATFRALSYGSTSSDDVAILNSPLRDLAHVSLVLGKSPLHLPDWSTRSHTSLVSERAGTFLFPRCLARAIPDFVPFRTGEDAMLFDIRRCCCPDVSLANRLLTSPHSHLPANASLSHLIAASAEQDPDVLSAVVCRAKKQYALDPKDPEPFFALLHYFTARGAAVDVWDPFMIARLYLERTSFAPSTAGVVLLLRLAMQYASPACAADVVAFLSQVDPAVAQEGVYFGTEELSTWHSLHKNSLERAIDSGVVNSFWSIWDFSGSVFPAAPPTSRWRSLVRPSLWSAETWRGAHGGQWMKVHSAQGVQLSWVTRGGHVWTAESLPDMFFERARRNGGTLWVHFWGDSRARWFHRHVTGAMLAHAGREEDFSLDLETTMFAHRLSSAAATGCWSRMCAGEGPDRLNMTFNECLSRFHTPLRTTVPPPEVFPRPHYFGKVAPSFQGHSDMSCMYVFEDQGARVRLTFDWMKSFGASALDDATYDDKLLSSPSFAPDLLFAGPSHDIHLNQQHAAAPDKTFPTHAAGKDSHSTYAAGEDVREVRRTADVFLQRLAQWHCDRSPQTKIVVFATALTQPEDSVPSTDSLSPWLDSYFQEKARLQTCHQEELGGEAEGHQRWFWPFPLYSMTEAAAYQNVWETLMQDRLHFGSHVANIVAGVVLKNLDDLSST